MDNYYKRSAKTPNMTAVVNQPPEAEAESPTNEFMNQPTHNESGPNGPKRTETGERNQKLHVDTERRISAGIPTAITGGIAMVRKLSCPPR